MFNAIKHFLTVTKHRHMVRKYCFKCGLYKQGLIHDLSKYSFAEFIPSVKYYANAKHSPNASQRKAIGYSSSWLHHKGRNKHHSEYWFDYNIELKKYAPVKMPDKYVAENICDRIAASKVYNKGHFTRKMVLDYFVNEEYRIIMHEDTFNKIKFLLNYYVSKGEKALFKYMKNYLKKNR